MIWNLLCPLHAELLMVDYSTKWVLVLHIWKNEDSEFCICTEEHLALSQTQRAWSMWSEISCVRPVVISGNRVFLLTTVQHHTTEIQLFCLWPSLPEDLLWPTVSEGIIPQTFNVKFMFWSTRWLFNQFCATCCT